MAEQTKTMATEELLQRLVTMAALIFEIGAEEDGDEIIPIKDAIGIIGKARELPAETVDKALADTVTLIDAIRNAEPGKESEVLKSREQWSAPQDHDEKMQVIQALIDECEYINEPDEWHRVDGLVHYLEDFCDIKATA